MAKRGCAPFSTRSTERPRRRSSNAVSEPAKPEPTTTTSQAPFMLSTVQSRPAQIGQATGAAASWPRFIAASRRSRSREANGAAAAAGEVPEVGEHEAAAERQRPRKRLLELGEGRRHEIAGRLEGLHGAVARASRDQRDDAGAAVEREVGGPHRPVHGLARLDPGQADQHERPQRDAVGAQSVRGFAKLRGGHALVEARENLGMDGLQPHRDFESSGQAPGQRGGAAADQRGMRLDDHALESGELGHDRVDVRIRDGLRVEEASGVVELDPARRREGGDGGADLAGDRARRRVARQRVLPEIAHQAPPGTLPIGQEDGRDRDRRAGLVRLLLEEKGGGGGRIDAVARAPLIQDPLIPADGGNRIRADHARFMRRGPESGAGNPTRRREIGRGCRAEPSAPCWKRRLGKTGIVKPVTAATPQRTTSPFRA